MVRNRTKRRSNQSSKSEAPVDPVLPEKKRARRRLIGAVALVLAAVIGLPMVLDSEPKPLADDIAIQIPSKDKPATSIIQGAEMPATSVVAASTALDPKEEIVDSPATVAEDTNSKQPSSGAVELPIKDSVEAQKDDAKPAAPAKLAHVATDKNDRTVVQPSRTDVKLVEKGDDEARAKALLEGKPDPKDAEKKSEKFVIQVAALATKEKVDELQAKLKSAGIKSYTQKVSTDSGDRTRIRVGPFASKDEAEKMRAKIVKLGLNGTLVPA